jgi:DNA-binding SARP family transcriptional activator
MDDQYPNLVRLYLPLLANSQPLVRRQACMIMLGTYGNRALSYVRRLIDDGDPQVRQNARLALLAIVEATDLDITFRPFRGMYIQCLGRLRLYIDHHEIQAHDWTQVDNGRSGWQKVQGAFAYLVHCGRRGATREALGRAVWDGSVSTNSLSRTLTTLRQTLTNVCGAAFVERALLIGEDHCILDPTYYHTDAQLFEHTFETASRVELEGGLETAIPTYTQATHLYAGPYMADVLGGNSWWQQRRDHLLNSFVIATERMAECAYTQQHYRQCIDICTAALDVDETADEVVIWLLRAYAQVGRHAELEQAYRRYARAMHLDLADREDQQDPVVQMYQSFGRT